MPRAWRRRRGDLRVGFGGWVWWRGFGLASELAELVAWFGEVGRGEGGEEGRGLG